MSTSHEAFLEETRELALLAEEPAERSGQPRADGRKAAALPRWRRLLTAALGGAAWRTGAAAE